MSPTLAELNALLTAPGSMFEVEEKEIRGIRTRVWKNAPPSLRTVSEQSRIHGSKDFLVYENERLSFEHHYRAAARVAHALRDRWSVQKGDRVAIAMRNFPERSAAFWGAAPACAVLVPLNAWWTGDELESGLADSGSKIVICDGERAARIASRLPRATSGAGAGGGACGTRAACQHRGFPRADRRFDAAADDSLPDVDLEPEDDATIFYTSGTTGKPKGALGTQRNICGNILSIAFVQVRNALRRGACWRSVFLHEKRSLDKLRQRL